MLKNPIPQVTNKLQYRAIGIINGKFTPHDSNKLNRGFLTDNEGEKIETDNIKIMSQYISEAVSGIPFYIHLLISELKYIDGLIDKKTVEETINKSLINPLTLWKMEHYRDRIDNYYTEDKGKYALKILDILAIESG